MKGKTLKKGIWCGGAALILLAGLAFANPAAAWFEDDSPARERAEQMVPGGSASASAEHRKELDARAQEHRDYATQRFRDNPWWDHGPGPDEPPPSTGDSVAAISGNYGTGRSWAPEWFRNPDEEWQRAHHREWVLDRGQPPSPPTHPEWFQDPPQSPHEPGGMYPGGAGGMILDYVVGPSIRATLGPVVGSGHREPDLGRFAEPPPPSGGSRLPTVGEQILEREAESLREGSSPGGSSSSGGSSSGGSNDWFGGSSAEDFARRSNGSGGSTGSGVSFSGGSTARGTANLSGSGDVSSFSFGDTSDVGSFGGSGNFSVGGR